MLVKGELVILHAIGLFLSDVANLVLDEMWDLGVIIDSRFTFHAQNTIVFPCFKASLIHNVL